MIEPQEPQKSIITARLRDKIRSAIAIRAETEIEVIITFRTAEALASFLQQQDEVAARVGALGEKRFTVQRTARSINAVTLKVRLDVLSALAKDAEVLDVDNVDENFRVDMLLGETHLIEKVDSAWDRGLDGTGVVVAVIDTGIDDTHPDLAGVVVGKKNLTSEGAGDKVGHGTHVACIIAGRGVADPTRKGISHGCTLLDAKVLGSDGTGGAADVVAGIEWAVEQKADILNMSLGACGPFDGTDPLSRAANWAVSQGAVVCAAAGNCGPQGNPLACPARGDKTINSPGCASEVITVGAVTKEGALAGYSSRGPTWADRVKPDVVTVGSSITAARAANTAMGTPVDNHYTTASGTSMATPVCSGIVAILMEAARSADLALTPAEIKRVVKAGTTPVPGLDENAQGAGFLDMEEALAHLERPGSEPAPPADVLEIVGFRSSGTGRPAVGEPREWQMGLRNSSDRDVGGAVVTLSPNTSVDVNPASQTVGDLRAGELTTVSFVIVGRSAGRFDLHVAAGYEDAPGAPPRKQSLTVTAAFGLAGAPSSSDTVLADAISKLYAEQNADGTWTGRILFNAWTNGLFCILHKILGLPEPTLMLDWLETHRTGRSLSRQADGTWGIIDPPSIHFLEATIASEIALEIWGRGRRQEAWDFIDQQGVSRLAPAISLTDPFTQAMSALASDYAPPGTPPYHSLGDVLAPPIELLLIPPLLKTSLARLFGAWGQDAITSLTAITTLKLEQRPAVFKQLLLKYVEAILLRSQNEDGSWYDTFLPALASTLGMHVLGYPNEHPVMQRAIAFLLSLQRPDGYTSRFRLPVWDTALSVVALRTAGADSRDQRLRKGCEYLMRSQTDCGGIPFQRENIPYPDTDDTSLVVLALNDMDLGPDEPAKRDVTSSALRWLLFMQGDDGGWAAFGKNQSVKTTATPVFKDDPPTADVTGHVLSSLKLAPAFGFADRARSAISSGISWLKRTQLPRGEWFGRWGLTYTYGTTAVLQGLSDLGQPLGQSFVQSGVQYLLNTQKPDGGWGEGYVTYYNFQAQDDSPSTATQTAWSLLGLMSVPRTAAVDQAVERGVQFLVDRYDSQKGWEQPEYTEGALWIYKNRLYPLMWGVWALSTYRKRMAA